MKRYRLTESIRLIGQRREIQDLGMFSSYLYFGIICLANNGVI